MEFKKENLVKSPLNYTGGKFKLLPQILPLFPNDIGTFVDLFGGGCNIGINVKANRVICNDIEPHVIDLMKNLSKLSSEKSLQMLKTTIEKYNLSKTNREGFEKIRNDYNSGHNEWNMFYAMLTNAFNYQIRFNKNGKYNMPFGKERSSFNPTLEKRFIHFVNELNSKNIVFTNNDFLNLKVSSLKCNDIVYCDPPYLVTCASYNEQEGWNQDKERALLNLLDQLHDNNIKFALSNVFENKGKKNEILIKWCEDNKDKYKVHYLNHTYGNCNYHAKDKNTNGTIEVLITNY